jgi:hypothetical protein
VGDKQKLHRTFPDDAQPICEPGATLEVFADDGSRDFAEIFDAVQVGHTVVRRKEPLKTF